MFGGLHHVTAIAGDPQQNLDFYIRVLGLRLVKRTVNFDDPGSYHFYFGDRAGNPGTLLTFFAWSGAPQGHAGAGNASSVAFAVPKGALSRWRGRLTRAGVAVTGDERLTFRDPDGLVIELVDSADGQGDSIVGLHSVAQLESGGCGKMGRGVIHHVAFRVADEAALAELRSNLIAAGQRVSLIKDRHYFHSIYFREPGGVLFEAATDGPGFLIDEPLDSLGESLCLPPWLQPIHDSIEGRLPALAPMAAFSCDR
jgi:glyoxalase family protein